MGRHRTTSCPERAHRSGGKWRDVYTIGQASARTDVSAGTLRAWERRYGIPAPAHRVRVRYLGADLPAQGWVSAGAAAVRLGHRLDPAVVQLLEMTAVASEA